ncbi:hypothetical protein AURANDRAFT_65038 [Aureococcus anophagefferens]|uniref:Tyrosinase copper-binding domain-containing protein n=1 Tax=Aureococcus anophagefferens TaxID=44056 RepID=F0YBS6_AURAN|nr:hypothetical protein AURANDRAFT_65038 [Aureococcus anophagefferens]EGB07328.1 hypothetical protein AURANDRAFT_65038 [Aureococcus anophagefferens]|eukprot:XP_009037955.1 hypothetical protein AURANDRAFT_65038 [Aureococcus anophagefferens]
MADARPLVGAGAARRPARRRSVAAVCAVAAALCGGAGVAFTGGAPSMGSLAASTSGTQKTRGGTKSGAGGAVATSAAPSSSPEVRASRVVDAGSTVRSSEIYPFLAASGAALVEPHVETNLTVHGAPDEASADPETWAWTVVQQNDMGESSAVLQLGEYVGRFGSTSIVLVFHSVGSYVATARWLGDVSTHVAAEANLICRYVRRNVRALSESERTRYLDGFQTLLRVNGTAGRRSFGAGYVSAHELTAVHLREAGQRLGDHMHDGVGFLTQHVALTSAFETSLQTIDASLAVPYWDFTEDRSAASTLEDLFDPAKNDVWRADWFGSATGSNHAVAEGRFAYQRVPAASDVASSVQNPFGLLRAPWNVNKSPFVTRAHAFCDATFALDDWPSCATHYDLAFSDATASWYGFANAASYAPHGGVHFMVGGYDNCGDVHARLDDVITPLGVGSLELALLQVPKNLWRNMLAEVPESCASDAPQAACHLRCVENAANASFEERAFFSRGMDRDYGSWLDDLNATGWARVLEVLCTTPWSPGEQVEAASPLDVSFWPIHPTLDRLTQYRRLVKPFDGNASDASWLGSSDHSAYCSTPKPDYECHGHHPWDLTVFQTDHYDAGSGRFVRRFATNAEIFEYSNPSDYKLPYVYDSFEWPHCEADGVVFPKPRAQSSSS